MNPLAYTSRFILAYSLISSILKNRKSTGKIGNLYKIPVIISSTILVLPLSIIDIALSNRKLAI